MAHTSVWRVDALLKLYYTQGAIHSISVVPEFSEKEDNLKRYTTIFETLLSKISVPFDFPPRISVFWGRMDSALVL